MPKSKTTTQPAKETMMKRQLQGEVVGANSQKTIHVVVKTTKIHPKYRKQYSTSKKYAVHDEKGVAKVGDMVCFQECRPLSKTKRWFVVEVVKKSAQ